MAVTPPPRCMNVHPLAVQRIAGVEQLRPGGLATIWRTLQSAGPFRRRRPDGTRRAPASRPGLQPLAMVNRGWVSWQRGAPPPTETTQWPILKALENRRYDLAAIGRQLAPEAADPAVGHVWEAMTVSVPEARSRSTISPLVDSEDSAEDQLRPVTGDVKKSRGGFPSWAVAGRLRSSAAGSKWRGGIRRGRRPSRQSAATEASDSRPVPWVIGGGRLSSVMRKRLTLSPL